VTVLNQALLQSQGVSSLSDALRDVRGIAIGGAEGGQIGNNVNLNGFNARTDIYLDGFRDRGQYYRDTFTLESVEALLGRSSMLFGRGSTGGAID
jgi:catecholate siderophore receptor